MKKVISKGNPGKVRVVVAGVAIAAAIAVILIYLAPILTHSYRDDVIAGCHEKMNWSDAMCDCVGDKAVEDLTENQLAFLVATLSDDNAERNRLGGELSVAEMGKAAMFMASAPAQCAQAQ